MFFWHRPKYIAMIALRSVATFVLELLVHGVVQIQADIQYKHKQADSKQTYKHMKAQTSRQQADIQTHESTWVVQMQAGIQYKHKQLQTANT
jgi:hypothetical protein